MYFFANKITVNALIHAIIFIIFAINNESMPRLILLFLYLVPLIGFSQILPQRAPLSTKFLNYISNIDSIKSNLFIAGDTLTGGLQPPSFINFDALNTKKNVTIKTTMFAQVYDMRNTNLLTSVKSQSGNGCWSYAVMSAVESRWKDLGLGVYDLSDNNLKYCHGFDSARNTYGNHYMGTAYFSRRSGPINEADDPYPGGSTGVTSCPNNKTPIAYISQARYLPNDSAVIKQALLDYGAIYTMMYWNSIYYNSNDYTYYYNGSTEVNHCVAIAGWNDTLTTAGGTGAWIIKNSWGTSWGDSGYFYISYNDSSILNYNAYWPEKLDYDKNATIYYYDDLGSYNSSGYGDSCDYGLVKFTADSDQKITKVGVFVNASNVIVDFEIYDNFSGVALSDLLGSLTNQPCQYPGYYTFEFTSDIYISKGDDFYIKVKYYTPGVNYPVPIEDSIIGYSQPFIEAGKFWMSNDGVTWDALGTTTSYQWDLCIKAYGRDMPTVWTGVNSNNWNDDNNWNFNKPDSTSDVIIPSGLSGYPVSNTGTVAYTKSLEIEPGAHLTVPAGKLLTVIDSLIIKSDASGSASLIDYGTLTVGGGIRVEQFLEGFSTGASRFHYISPPVKNAISNVFWGAYLYSFNEFTNAWDPLIAGDSLKLMTGYASYFDDDSNNIISYYNNINTGFCSIDVDSTPGGGGGWNLIGNPYASAIDWDDANWSKPSGLYDAIYLWDPSNQNYAQYVSGVGSPYGTTGIIPAMQGFFIKYANSATGTIGVDNNARVHNGQQIYKSQTKDKLVRLKIEGGGFFDETVIRFDPNSSSSFDGNYDAYEILSMNLDVPQLFSLSNDETTMFSINTMPLLSGDQYIPLGIKVGKAAKYSIKMISFENFSMVPAISLKDENTGSSINLLKDSIYFFTTELGQDNERFVLHINVDAVDIPEDNGSGDNIELFTYNDKLYIKINDAEIKGASVGVYDLLGREIIEHQINQGSLQTIDLYPHKGCFIIRVFTGKNIYSSKVIVR